MAIEEIEIERYCLPNLKFTGELIGMASLGSVEYRLYKTLGGNYVCEKWHTYGNVLRADAAAEVFKNAVDALNYCSNTRAAKAMFKDAGVDCCVLVK